MLHFLNKKTEAAWYGCIDPIRKQGTKISSRFNLVEQMRKLSSHPSPYAALLVTSYVYRFRGYFQALMSSAKVLLCHPGRLFLRRSESKSSLDIGVRPMDGVVRMELHHFTNQAPARRTRRQPFNTAATANGATGGGVNTKTATLPIGK